MLHDNVEQVKFFFFLKCVCSCIMQNLDVGCSTRYRTLHTIQCNDFEAFLAW